MQLQKQAMLDLLKARGVNDPRVLEALTDVPRERFVPEGSRKRAYFDSALPIAASQTISQPYIVALMTQELGLTGDERVLEIGTGSGYQTAILARLCAEVVTIERHEELLLSAQSILSELEVNNVDFRIGDGTLGCPERAPYEAIIVAAAAPAVPEPLYEQLVEGGRLVIPVGNQESQTLQVVTRGETPEIRRVCGCRFVKLIGASGWRE